MNRMSVLAVGAGVLVTIVVTTAVDIALHLAGVYPPMGSPLSNTHAVTATSYRVVIGTGAAWVTAHLAPDRPMRHAILLGSVGTALGLLGVLVAWNKGLGPAWYPIALAVLALPQCWAGGKLHEWWSARRMTTGVPRV